SGVRFELGSEDDRELRIVFRQLIRSRPDEELLCEKGMPGALRHNANRESVGRVGPSETALNVEVLAFQERSKSRVQPLEGLRGHRLIDGAPVDVLLRACVADDVLVLWRPAGELSCTNYQRSIVCQRAFARLDRNL